MATSKYAFIMNSEALTPAVYNGMLLSAEAEACFYAVHSLEMAAETAAGLAAEGVSVIDLCGDYDEAAAGIVQEAVGEQTRVCHMKYLPEELKKLEALESMIHYGIIIMNKSFKNQPARLVMESDEFTTYVAATGSIEEAGAAAAAFVAEGVDFIELSSDFDEQAARTIIGKIEGKVPVGFAG